MSEDLVVCELACKRDIEAEGFCHSRPHIRTKNCGKYYCRRTGMTVKCIPIEKFGRVAKEPGNRDKAPKCQYCGKADKVVVAHYGHESVRKDFYWECERCNCVVKRISKFKLD